MSEHHKTRKTVLAILVVILVTATLIILQGCAVWKGTGVSQELPTSTGGSNIGSEQVDENSSPTPPSENESNHEDASLPETETTEEPYWIDVDVTEQKVYIMKDNTIIKEMIASTGKEGHETPLGEFEIQNRGTWFFNEKYGQGAKYWVSFKDWGIYLFHSVAMDQNQKVIPEEEAKLGTPASHGCIRLPIEDAKWIHDNIPEKTKVVIHQ